MPRTKSCLFRFTPDVIDFFKSNCHKGMYYLQKEIEERYGFKISKSAMYNLADRNSVSIERFSNGYNWYIEEYIRENYNKISMEELLKQLKEKFGFEKDRRNFMMYCNKHFNFKYNKNLEHLPIGTEREYLYKNQKTIFVKYRNLPTDKNNHEMKVNWMRKTRYVFEKHYGTIPKGYNIIQLDGDYRNCDIDNLRCVSTKALRIINRYKAYGKTIITDALIKVLELDNDIKELIERRN